MIKVVHCHNCNGTGSKETIDDCEVCKGVGTYRIFSKSIISKYSLEKLNIPFLDIRGEQRGSSPQNDKRLKS
jgi:RecJ-like exonuclease